jgi:alpha-galactosidase
MCESRTIRIETSRAALVLTTDCDGRLFQSSFGAKDREGSEPQVAYPASGDGWYLEPALRVTHADGSTATDLRVTDVETNGSITTIKLKDPEYAFFVDLFFRAFPDEDVLETWVEIRHQEPGVVTLEQFASSSLDLGLGDRWLTQFHGDWANEANMSEEKLSFGIKILDSKLGVRAHQFRAPWFLLSLGAPSAEDEGEVIGGSLAWSGSFAFKFEVDPHGRLRANCGAIGDASTYQLEADKLFRTPHMIWGWSAQGTGALSRNLQSWVRQNALREGCKPRAILLNNWEATYFTFDEQKIVSLFDGAKELGMELFLLDDGWFGVKYPRNDDTQGLGDWVTDPAKLPNGIGALTKAAAEREIRFGIWLEPEMVNPRSELFEEHPDWAIQQPKRTLELQRNQLILDLTNPAVKEYVYEVADRTIRENPGISYIKWDCNRYVTQPGSAFLGPERQSHLWIEYVRGLYEVFGRLAKNHPGVQIMMCSGGGGRVDHGAMRYAQEFWPSDQTDPAKRVFIQWGYSHFFPAISMSAHVTDMGHKPIKFAFDVAMSGRLGMDMDVSKLTPEEFAFAKRAVESYKRIRDVVQLGEQYRLESPYAGPRSALMYVYEGRAAVFVYSLGESPAGPLALKGLEGGQTYRVEELNAASGALAVPALEGGKLALPALGLYESRVFLLEN